MTKYAQELPNNLESGGVIISPKGTVGKVVVTSKKNKYGERLYRLRYYYKFSSGEVYTLKSQQPYYENRITQKGNVLVFIGYGWTRDQLAQLGCKYVRKDDVAKSRVLSQAKKRTFGEMK